MSTTTIHLVPQDGGDTLTGFIVNDNAKRVYVSDAPTDSDAELASLESIDFTGDADAFNTGWTTVE